MHFSSFLASALALATSSTALQKGFNYGATNADGSCRKYEDFHRMFLRSHNLAGAPGFTSARLYTSIQCGSDNAPIEAIKAALDTQTNLMLGLWASAGQAFIDNELIAIKYAAEQWPQMMKARVKAISVGSEDMYRASDEGQANGSGAGATKAEVVKYIKQVRTALKGTVLEGVKVGHVDTYTGWEANKKVINDVDFIGFNGFPYFETTKPNGIRQSANLFQTGLTALESFSNGKPVWVTETGWPGKYNSSGPTAFAFCVLTHLSAWTQERQRGCQPSKLQEILDPSRLQQALRQIQHLLVHSVRRRRRSDLHVVRRGAP